MKIFRIIKFEIQIQLKNFYLWRKKRSAMNMHKLTGRRFHVIPTSNDKLIVVDNGFVDLYNKSIKNKGKKINIEDLLQMSFFSTPVQGITREFSKSKKSNK